MKRQIFFPFKPLQERLNRVVSMQNTTNESLTKWRVWIHQQNEKLNDLAKFGSFPVERLNEKMDYIRVSLVIKCDRPAKILRSSMFILGIRK